MDANSPQTGQASAGIHRRADDELVATATAPSPSSSTTSTEPTSSASGWPDASGYTPARFSAPRGLLDARDGREVQFEPAVVKNRGSGYAPRQVNQEAT